MHMTQFRLQRLVVSTNSFEGCSLSAGIGSTSRATAADDSMKKLLLATVLNRFNQISQDFRCQSGIREESARRRSMATPHKWFPPEGRYGAKSMAYPGLSKP